MKVLKFGGSSIATPQRIKDVITIVNEARKQFKDIVVVFSAFGGTTDQLIKVGALASSGDDSYKELLKEIEKRHLEAVKELVSISHQTSALANVKMMMNELEDLLRGIFLLLNELSACATLDFIMSFGETVFVR